MATKPPIGYKTVGDKGHKIHVIDEDKAPFIRKMFELYATSNYSIKRLTELLYKDGLRNLNGNKIVKSRIHQYLNDPFYIGKLVWKGFTHDGKHEPLIDEGLFQIVKTTLRAKTTPKYSKHNFLFRQLFRCSECEGFITWETAKGHVYGHCNHYRNCSQRVWVKEPDIEKQLVEKLSQLEIKSPRLAEWLRKALKESHKDEITYHSSSVGDISKQHDLIKQRLDKLYDEKLDGKISEDFYQTKFKQYSDELKTTDKAIEKHSNASLKYFELGINLYELSQKATEIYYKADVDQRRLLLRMVFQDLTMNEGLISYKLTKPFQILYNAIQITNSSKMMKTEENGARIFEPSEKTDNTVQMGDISLLRPNWLPR